VAIFPKRQKETGQKEKARLGRSQAGDKKKFQVREGATRIGRETKGSRAWDGGRRPLKGVIEMLKQKGKQ